MGKASTAGRLARIGDTGRRRKGTHIKIANKKSQKTPKTIKKQRAKVKKEVEEKEKLHTNVTATLNKWSWQKFQSNKQQTSKRNKKSKNNQTNKSMTNGSKKPSEKRDAKLNTIDFSTYDRIESGTEDENDDEHEDDEANALHETNRKPFSWNDTKQKMPVVSSRSGEWTTSNAREKTALTEEEEIVNKDVAMTDVLDAMNEDMVADYMGIGLDSNANANGDSNEKANAIEEDEPMAKESDAEEDKEADKEPPNAEEWLAQKKLRATKLKLEMANICEKMSEDPYTHVTLLKLLIGLTKDNDIEVAQYAMLSLTRLLSDILPQYKIGTLAEVSALKKENEQVKQFEAVVLKVYRNFLFDLSKHSRIFHAQTKKKTERENPRRFIIGRCAAKCLCLFLEKCFNVINCAKDLIQHCIPLMNSADEDVRKRMCDSMFHVLSQTPISNVTVECVRLITKKIEQRNFDVFPEMVRSLLGLSLKHLEPPDRKNEDEEEEKPTKNKHEKKLEKLASKDLKELDGDIDKKREYERQKVIIDNLFAVYFYVLKVDVHRSLLPAALEGMAKYCHLINVELLLDLIAVVSEKLANEKDTMSLDCKLHCVITTFRCLSGRGASVDMDIKEHYSTIYQTLLKVIYPENWPSLRLMFTCLDLMFGRSHQVPIDRTAAFVKRLTTIACHLPPQWGLAALHMARRLIRSDSRLNAMLEHGGGFDQAFDPLAQHPDHSNARASCLFELTCTSQSYHPFQKLYSKDLASWSEVPLGLATAKPIDLFTRYDCSDGNFTPAVKQGKINAYSTSKHPPETWNSADKTSQIIDWFEFPSEKIKVELEEKVSMLKGFYPQAQTKQRQLQETELKIVKGAVSYTAHVARIEQMNTTLRGTKQQFRELNDFIQTF